MAACSLCNNTFQDRDLVQGICGGCREAHGTPAAALTPPRRPAIPCARCGAGSFVRGLVLRDHTVAPLVDANVPALAPIAVTYGVEKRDVGIFTSREVTRVAHDVAHGLIESYTCRGCGFIELYARDAASIPIGPEYGTELFEVPVAPYRT
jgi:hypothetical protein